MENEIGHAHRLENDHLYAEVDRIYQEAKDLNSVHIRDGMLRTMVAYGGIPEDFPYKEDAKDLQ